MTEAQERLKAAAIRDARQKIASGEWSITPSQLAMFRKMSARSPGLKATPDKTRVLLESMRQAAGFIQEVLRAEGIPEPLRAVLQEAVEALEGTGPTEETGEEGVKATIASLSRRQADQEIHLGLRENQLKSYLQAQRSPPPEPPKGKAAEGERATAFVDEETREAGRDDIATSRLRRKLNEELRRGKTR